MAKLAAAILASLLCFQGCATSTNYPDAAGPLFIAQRPSPATPRGPLRLVTFNIKFGEHVDGAIRLLSDSAPAPFRNPDVLVLQEMDRDGVARIAEALHVGYVYVPSAVHPSSHRDFGVAVLSPWPISSAQKIELPHQHRFRKMRRAAAAATLDTPLGAVRVYAVHLETPFGATDRERSEQAGAVLADAAGWPGAAVIAGDFNGSGGVQAVARAGFTWTTRHAGHTVGLFALDHIFVRGLCPAGARPAGVGPKASGVSDHRLAWAIVGSCPR